MSLEIRKESILMILVRVYPTMFTYICATLMQSLHPYRVVINISLLRSLNSLAYLFPKHVHRILRLKDLSLELFQNIHEVSALCNYAVSVSSRYSNSYRTISICEIVH